MEKSEAKEMLQSLLACQRKLDEALLVANNISSSKEKEQIKSFLMSVIADVYVESIRKIVIQYPDLDPY